LRSNTPTEPLNGEGVAEPNSLTTREVAVLRHLASGKPNKEIATVLSISERTVKFHVSSVMTKLRARNRTEAVKIAIVDRLIKL